MPRSIAILVIVVILLMMPLTFNAQSQPNETPSAPANVIVQVTPTPSLQDQINQLSSRIDTVSEDSLISLLIDRLVGLPLYMLLLLIVFYRPIVRFLDRIANSAHSVRIGEFSVELSDVELLLVEREILRFSITLADADGDFSKDESTMVLSFAKDMPEYLHLLTERGKYEVLKKALNIAAADGEIRETEYNQIMKFATKFEMSQAEIDQKILAICREENVTPPPQISHLAL